MVTSPSPTTSSSPAPSAEEAVWRLRSVSRAASRWLEAGIRVLSGRGFSLCRALMLVVMSLLWTAVPVRAQGDQEGLRQGGRSEDRVEASTGRPARRLGPGEAPRIRRRSAVGLAEGQEPPIVQVELELARGRRAIPLGEEAEEVEVFEVGEDAFVLTYGGRGSRPLVFHVVDRRTGLPERLVVDGAIRLPSDFLGAAGSTPLVLPGGVFLLIWDEGGRLRFRLRTAVVPVGGAGLEVPLETAEVRHRFDTRSRQIDLEFLDRAGARTASFSFQHPSAPIAVLSTQSRLDFGASLVGARRTRRVMLRNEGGFPLRGVLRVQGEGFSWSGTPKPAIDIAPQGFEIVSIDWIPSTPGESVGELSLRAEVPSASRRIDLVGFASAAAGDASGPAAGGTDEGLESTELPDERIERPELQQSVIRWLEPSWVEVRGRLETPAAGLLEVFGGRGHRATAAVDDAGNFRSVLPAEVGDRIDLGWVGDSRRVFCGRIGPVAFRSESEFVAEVFPGALVEFVETVGGPASGPVDGRAFVRRADAAGRTVFRVPPGSSASDFRVRIRDAAGVTTDVPVLGRGRSDR